jgi:type IX secretion system PorP/SprF family membrane protein
MRKKIIIAALIGLAFSPGVKAQDFHLTQYDAFHLYQNPALTGNYLGEETDYKINSVYRSQWRSMIRKPFTTYGISYDQPYKRFGIGAYILNNRSGAAKFNTLNFQVSGSYFITDPVKSPHLLNVGLQLGLFYKSFKPDNLLFESQYDYSTGSLNSDLDNGENFERTSLVKFDANFGVFYKYKEDNKKYAPFFGFSVFHLSKPSESFNNEKERVPMRFNVNAGCDFKINDKFKVTPTVLYMTQANATDLNIGVMGYYRIKDTKSDVMLGLNYRLKDAVSLQVGIKQNEQHTFRISYDVNTSYLNHYTGGRGAIEFSLILSGKKNKPLFSSKF